jgi:hypothetical protein
MGNPQKKNPQAKNICLLHVEGLINFQRALSKHNYFIYQSYRILQEEMIIIPKITKVGGL